MSSVSWNISSTIHKITFMTVSRTKAVLKAYSGVSFPGCGIDGGNRQWRIRGGKPGVVNNQWCGKDSWHEII